MSCPCDTEESLEFATTYCERRYELPFGLAKVSA